LARKLHCMPTDTRTMFHPPTALIAVAIAVLATGQRHRTTLTRRLPPSSTSWRRWRFRRRRRSSRPRPSHRKMSGSGWPSVNSDVWAS